MVCYVLKRSLKGFLIRLLSNLNGSLPMNWVVFLPFFFFFFRIFVAFEPSPKTGAEINEQQNKVITLYYIEEINPILIFQQDFHT